MGVKKLKVGVKELKMGVKELKRGVKELKRGVKELKMLGFKLLDRSIQAFSKISVVPGGGKGRGKREVALTRQQTPEGSADQHQACMYIS